MAGDLFILSLQQPQIDILEAAGAQRVTSIFHSNRTGQEYWDILMQRLNNPNQPNNRTNLPPHTYITIPVKTPFKANVQRNGHLEQMNVLLGDISRPTSIVTSQPALADWEQTPRPTRIDYLDRAVQNIPVTIEYYKVGNKSVLDYYRNSGYKLIPEQ